MGPDMVLRALRELIGRIDEIYDHPERDWSQVAIEALQGVEALDGWLSGGGDPPIAWTTTPAP